MRATAPIAGAAIVVPVRDEEDRLERCLAAIARAVDALPDRVATEVVVVLDGCTDRSAHIAARRPFTVIEIDASGVGRARAVGVAEALAAFPGIPAEQTWIANTDADSEVPPEWLTRQLALADAGWDAVLGTVAPDPAELPPELRGTPIACAATDGEPIYGANLGVRADAYLRAGGFAPACEHEDVQLVTRLRHDAAPVTACYDIPVLTSARLRGRTPGGYAEYLRSARGDAERRGAPSAASARSFCIVQ